MNYKDRTFRRGAVAVALGLVMTTVGVLPGLSASFIHAAHAQHTTGGHESGGKSGSASHRGGKGPDPNCAFQDRTGRGKGGFGPQAMRGKGGHSSGHTDEGDHSSGGVHSKGGGTDAAHGGGDSTVVASDSGGGVIGGGSGGEGYVCDGPGGWGVESKVLRR